MEVEEEAKLEDGFPSPETQNARRTSSPGETRRSAQSPIFHQPFERIHPFFITRAQLPIRDAKTPFQIIQPSSPWECRSDGSARRKFELGHGLGRG